MRDRWMRRPRAWWVASLLRFFHRCPECGCSLDDHMSVDDLAADDPFVMLQVELGEHPNTCGDCADCTYDAAANEVRTA